MAKRTVSGAASAFIMIHLLTACATDSSQNTATPQASQAPSDLAGSTATKPSGVQTTSFKTGKKITVAYSSSTCEAPTFVAWKKGFFEAEGLEPVMEKMDFNTLKNGIATGKVDATQGNFSWFKPAEQGLDVKLTGGLHAGCIQAVAPAHSGITAVKDLKGKIIGVDAIGGGPMITLSIELKKLGIDPKKDVQWRVYPSDQLVTAAEKKEIDAFIVWDPAAQKSIDENKYVRILSNAHDEPYKSGYCCYSFVSGELAKKDPEKAAAYTRAILKAAEWVGTHQTEAAQLEVDYKLVGADLATNEKLLKDYYWRPSVNTAVENAKFFIGAQKEQGVLDASTDEEVLADRLIFKAIPEFNGR
ncbi:ABC transporter substrate-binding protein [Paenibacillus sp. SYP-B3998]|uniref:ABC transporter substrate-binding protein n=1 Tax=Paenibacillus sp. SYP-B3998 TaxID=2678564 RepID=A0A6G3ZRW2_9BACL|nr:ABC transporter substrate-binding protein [Paenibacillus sp. SYP-B3998]NEW04872.1 ABC transporter substrate-binding protein [Paenibacillus sp. SYP-B3998]